MSKTVSGCIKVLPRKFISNVVAKYVRKFVSVCKFVSVHMFAQSLRSPSYRVLKRYDFNLVNKVIFNTKRSVSVCRKVRKSVLFRVSTSIFHALRLDAVNVTLNQHCIYLLQTYCFYVRKMSLHIPPAVNISATLAD